MNSLCNKWNYKIRFTITQKTRFDTWAVMTYRSVNSTLFNTLSYNSYYKNYSNYNKIYSDLKKKSR